MVSRTFWNIVGFVVMVVVADIIAIGIYFSIQPINSSSSASTSSDDDVLAPLPPSNSTMGVYGSAAVVSVGAPCAAFGREMLLAGGNAVDAAIAVLLCDGVCVMQSMGVGGGFLMTVYNSTEKKAYSLVARETAPALANETMYVNRTRASTVGALAPGIPGELKGYQAAHQRFGRLPWSTLFQPTIALCENGVPVSKRMAENFISSQAVINDSPTFLSVVLNSTGGRLPMEGELLKLPRLANTLRVIAGSANMAEELYNGTLTKQFVADIQTAGGIISEHDMNNYDVRWEEPYNASLSGNLTAYSAALPGSGILLTFILRLMDGFLQFAYSETERSQLIVEAFKHAYGRRTDLCDPHYCPNQTLCDQVTWNLTNTDSILAIRKKILANWTTDDVSYYGADYLQDDHGTNNIAVVDQQGNAVTTTSTVNLLFGSKFVSTSTGIILNNQMDDFSTPGLVNSFGVSPSAANFIDPGKRPLSSMSPTVVVDSEGNVRLAVGAAGGSMITTQTTLVTIRNLFLGRNIKEAIDEPRFHHQLLPMNISYEYGILKETVDAWHTIGHSTRRVTWPSFLAVVTGIARLGDNLTASYDWRKTGSVSGI